MRVRLDPAFNLFDVFSSLIGRSFQFLLVFSLGPLVGVGGFVLGEIFYHGWPFDLDWVEVLYAFSVSPLWALLSLFHGLYYAVGIFFFLATLVSFIVLVFTDTHPLHPTVWLLLSQSWNNFLLFQSMNSATSSVGSIFLVSFTLALLAFYGFFIYNRWPARPEPLKTNSVKKQHQNSENRYDCE